MIKNSSLAINIVLGVAVLVLYILHFSANSKPKGEEISASSASKPGDTFPIAYVNVDSLLNSYDFYKDSKEILMAKRNKLEASLNQKTSALEKKAQDFQYKAQKMLITQRQAEETQQQLGQEQQSLMQTKEQMQMQLMQDEQVMNKQLMDSVQSFIKDYNKSGKFKYIISNTMGSPVLWGDKALNITNDMIAGLNARYKKK